MSSLKSVENSSPYTGSPLEFCPHCYNVGRGYVSFIPVMMSHDEVIWLCRNWKICPFPHFYGQEAVRRQTVPRRTVDPSLLGFIPLHDGDLPRKLLEEEKTMNSFRPPLSSSPASSHCTTSSSEGCDRDYHAANSAIPPTAAVSTYTTLMPPTKPPPAVIPLEHPIQEIEEPPMDAGQALLDYFNSSTLPTIVSSGAQPLMMAVSTANATPTTGQESHSVSVASTTPNAVPAQSYASMVFGQSSRASPIIPPTSAVQSQSLATQSAPPVATSTPAAPRKRPLLKQSDKTAFPAYGSSADVVAPETTQPSAKKPKNSDLLSMVAKQLAKVRRDNADS